MGLAVFRERSFIILLSLFMICTLFYYFGELVDAAGWTSLRNDFFFGVHDIHRLLFLAPIIYAGHTYRVKGAVIFTLAAFIAFLPRAIGVSPYPDPMLRIVLFTIVAGVLGTFTGVIRNQNELRNYLEALLTGERDKLRGILERMEDGVMIIGPDYRVRYLNPSMVREFGEGVGIYCYKYLHNFDEPCERICKVPEVINGATERWEYNFQDGRTYEVVASPFVDADGANCQLSTFRNITQRKQVELQLIELDKLKSEILSNVSHELRSPLTSIKGITSSLLQKDIELDDETKEMLLRGVGEETDRLASFVTKLLDMSRIEAGAWKPEMASCYISDIIDEVFESLKWIHRHYTFMSKVEPDLPEIRADCNQIRRVLTNLLENAAAYSKEGSQIIVRAENSGGEIDVSVCDKGAGIPQEDLEKIFEKFYRGSQQRKNPGGTGLGLAICKAIVTNHGGRIWAESELGHGSTFHFTLPVMSKQVAGQGNSD